MPLIKKLQPRLLTLNPPKHNRPGLHASTVVIRCLTACCRYGFAGGGKSGGGRRKKVELKLKGVLEGEEGEETDMEMEGEMEMEMEMGMEREEQEDGGDGLLQKVTGGQLNSYKSIYLTSLETQPHTHTPASPLITPLTKTFLPTSQSQKPLVLRNYLLLSRPIAVRSLPSFLQLIQQELQNESQFLVSEDLFRGVSGSGESGEYGGGGKDEMIRGVERVKEFVVGTKGRKGETGRGRGRGAVDAGGVGEFQVRYYQNMMEKYNESVLERQKEYDKVIKRIFNILPFYYNMLLAYTQFQHQNLDELTNRKKSKLINQTANKVLSSQQIFNKLYTIHPLIKFEVWNKYNKIHDQYAKKNPKFAKTAHRLPILFFRHPYQLYIIDQCLKNNISFTHPHPHPHPHPFQSPQQLSNYHTLHTALPQQLQQYYQYQAHKYLAEYERQLGEVGERAGVSAGRLRRLVEGQFGYFRERYGKYVGVGG